MDPLVERSLSDLVEPYRARTRAPRARALAIGVVAVVAWGLLLARWGTPSARIGSGALAVGAAVLAAVLHRMARRRLADSRVALTRAADREAPAEVDRALRALSLLEQDNTGTSVELARLHFTRRLAQIPKVAVERGARRAQTALSAAAFALLVFGLASLFVGGWGLVEGADVLFARKGVAPVSLAYLGDVELRARPPQYLHEDEKRRAPYTDLALPRGTLVSFSGSPVHKGRALYLSDGKTEIPFVGDGSGRLVARWSLGESADLRVVARFGGVVIEEPEATHIESIPDLVPVVTVEGAPRTIKLAAEGDHAEIPLRFEARDDHGLREIHLVLRAGAREERRELSRLDGETRLERGGYALRTSDPFLKKTHVPVEVRVEARDNDTVTGPKWGKSEAITIIPPAVGEPEAMRLDALRKLRDRFVDSLASRMSRELPADAKERAAFVHADLAGVEEDGELLEATITTGYGPVKVPERLGALLRGQMDKVKAAAALVARTPSKGTHGALVKASERMALVSDAVLQGLALKDARATAGELADVADELALAALAAQRAEERAPATVRMASADVVLKSGAKSLSRMGSLGRDLGEIVPAYLLRVDRAKAKDDFVHAELAAKDLALRLHTPDPSFGARGSGGRAGGESGGSPGMPESSAPDEVEQAFDEAAGELGKLAMDHAGQMGKLDRATGGAPSPEEMKAFAEEAKKHAESVREAVKRLPNVGAGSDSWTGKGSAAKELAEQMARALETGNPADAVSSGKAAEGALDEAKRQAQRERWGFGGARGEAEVEDAKKKLEPELRWAEEKLAEMKRRAEERARPEIAKQADDEKKIADRARALGERGRGKDALPQKAVEKLDAAERAARDAARAMKSGDVKGAQKSQEEAQRQLELAKEALGKDASTERDRPGPSDKPRGHQDDVKGAPVGHADIPDKDAYKGPEEFRQRVMRGLGQPSGGRHKDALRRYAEGLLR